MGWTIFFLFVVLKLPVFAAFWLIWYATRPVPAEPVDERSGGGDGGSGHRRPRRPRPPRRGPHAEPPPPAPRRVRAEGRTLVRHR